MSWQRSYPTVYRSLAPEYRSLPVEQVEPLLVGSLGLGLEDAEGFLDDIGKVARRAAKAVGGVAQQAAPLVAQAAPGALSGAVAGAPLGPAGVIGGAALGGLSAAFARRPTPGALPAAAPPRSGAGALNPPGTAVAQLLAALSSPTVAQGLSAMLLGRAGARGVPSSGGGQIPVAAITNLLALLASRATAEWEQTAPYDGEDFLDVPSTDGVDLNNPQARADVVLGQLAAPAEWFAEPEDDVEADWDDADELDAYWLADDEELEDEDNELEPVLIGAPDSEDELWL